MTRKLPVYSPYDGNLLKELEYMPAQKVEECIELAHRLFRDRHRSTKPYERVDILRKAAALVEERQDELARQVASEGGKPLEDARVEIGRAKDGLLWAASSLAELVGREIPMNLTPSSLGRLAFTQREPVGVVLAISAFNHPFNLIVHQIAPAIAAGCPVLVKPASKTPLSCLSLVEILQEAGLPPEWCQVILCSNELAEKLVSDARMAFLTFIGSARVGWHLRSRLAEGAHCSLEHGGAAPVIVTQDADLEDALPLLLKGAFYHAGQVCVSVQRIFAHEKIAADLADRIAALAAKLKVGDPLLATTEVGPLIRHVELERVENWINEARTEGAEVRVGGQRLDKNCLAPTVLWNPSLDSKVSREEIFGPVVNVYPYQDASQAVSQANNIPFAFQAAVFGKNIDEVLVIAKRLEARAVMVNDHTAFRVDWMPFGGRKKSGLGVGGIPETMRDMTYEKLFVIRSAML